MPPISTSIGSRPSSISTTRCCCLSWPITMGVNWKPASSFPASTPGADLIPSRISNTACQSLHRLPEHQHYRLAYWRVASDEINYRRFFNINDLAGIRVENPELFAAIHRLVTRLIGERKLHGLRIDHIDGLFDPGEYCAR